MGCGETATKITTPPADSDRGSLALCVSVPPSIPDPNHVTQFLWHFQFPHAQGLKKRRQQHAYVDCSNVLLLAQCSRRQSNGRWGRGNTDDFWHSIVNKYKTNVEEEGGGEGRGDIRLCLHWLRQDVKRTTRGGMWRHIATHKHRAPLHGTVQ